MRRTKHAQGEAEEARSSIPAMDTLMSELSNQFLSAKCWELFYRNFSKWNIVVDRNIYTLALKYFLIREMFLEQGWETLLDLGTEIFPKYIQIFFSNMSYSYDTG